MSEAVRLLGNFTHLVDDKGRVSLPVDFRSGLESENSRSVVLTNFISDGQRCVEGFSEKQWQAFEEKLKRKSRFDSKIQKLEHFYFSRATLCSLDKSGRMLIPVHLRAYASLEKEVVFTSSLNGFRLWDSRVWGAVFENAEQALIEDPELFREIDL